MAKKTKEPTKPKKITDKGKKTFGKPVDVTGVSGGKAVDTATPVLYK
jgi:hypothetical protein